MKIEECDDCGKELGERDVHYHKSYYERTKDEYNLIEQIFLGMPKAEFESRAIKKAYCGDCIGEHIEG